MTENEKILKIRAFVQALRMSLGEQRDANLDQLIVYIDKILRDYSKKL